MLGKLIKYEFKATGRTFLPLYGAILLVALIQRFLGRSNKGVFEELNTLGNFTNLALGGLLIALVVITLIVTIQRFQKNLLSDEGYLMFTLPVKIRSLIIAKMLVAVTWVILSGIVGVITFIVLFATGEFFAEVGQMFSIFIPRMMIMLQDEVGRMGLFVITQFALATFLMYIQFVVLIYLSLAIGQFPSFQKHRTAASFIAFFVINTAINWITGMTMLGSLYTEANMDPTRSLFIANIMAIVFIVVMFEGTTYILKKHLNLE